MTRLNMVSTIPLQISEKNENGITEMSEISYGPLTLVMHNGEFHIVAISSKEGKDNSYGIPKGKVNINEYLEKEGKYIEPSSIVSNEEFKEETGITIKNKEVLHRFEDIYSEERNTYKHKEGEKKGEVKEISNKTIIFQPMIVSFGLDIINQLAEGRTHVDSETDELGNSKGKERIVKLIPISQVDKFIKKDQLKTVKSFINKLSEEKSFGKDITKLTQEYYSEKINNVTS